MRNSLPFHIYCLLIIFLIFSPVHADPPKEQSKTPPEELALLLLSYGQFNQVVETMAESAMQAFRPDIEKKICRELSRTEDEQFRLLYKKVFAEVYPKEFWVEVISKVYSDFFTIEEIRSLISFYKTPTGKKTLYVYPSLTKELETVSVNFSKKRETFLLRRLEEELSKVPSLKSLLDDSDVNSEKTIADFGSAMDICKQIQEAQDIPIGCDIFFLDDNETPTLLVTFESYEHVNLFWEKLRDKVALPFCNAANSASYDGIVVLYLISNEQARIFTCTTGEWTDWLDYTLPKNTF